MRLTCARPNCTGTFVPIKGSSRKYCSVGCQQWGRQQTRGERIPRNSSFTVETGPPITSGIDTLPHCGCGRRMDPTTDVLGRTILQCVCGKTAPVRIIGRHRYDQYERHRAELKQLVSRGKTRVPESVSEYVGDAYRQDTHKRGRGSKGLAA